MQDPRIESLDGLRALAIFLVVVWHYIVGTLNPELFGGAGYLIKKSLAWTWSGVDLFFLLSGFLIGKILISRIGSKRYLSVFYLRRALRILPLYFLVLIFYLLLRRPLGGDDYQWLFNDPAPTWTYFAFLQNYWMAEGFGAAWLSVTWSLAVEEQFYLILPLIVLLSFERVRVTIFIIGFIAAPIYRHYFAQNFEGYVYLIGRCDTLFAGTLIAEMYLRSDNIRFFKTTRGHLALLLVSILGALLYVISRVFLGMYIGSALIHSALIAFYSPLLIYLLFNNESRLVRKIFANRACLFFSQISYGLYLLHLVVLGLVFGFFEEAVPSLDNFSDAILIVGSFGLTVLLCRMSYLFIERPLTDIGRRFKYTA